MLSTSTQLFPSVKLIPYGTIDGEDEKPSSTTNGNGKMSEADRVNFCDRKRQHENDDDVERMTKKIKFGNKN
jgi:hypothetical protein